MSIDLYQGDCLDVLKTLPADSIEACLTDPPYGFSDHAPQDVVDCLRAWINGEPYRSTKKGLLGLSWDAWVPGPEVWREVYRVLKPGSHLLCFAGTRSMDLMSMAIRLAGFELRDSIGYAHDDADGGGAPLLAWVQSQSMPHGSDVAKQLRKLGHATEAAQWEGWKSSLKPAWEPILLARKPFAGTLASNIVCHGTGALHIDACRIPVDPVADASQMRTMTRGPRDCDDGWGLKSGDAADVTVVRADGRFPANVIHSGEPETMAVFAKSGEKTSGKPGTRRKPHEAISLSGGFALLGHAEVGFGDTGGVDRFFYCSKVNKDKHGSKHPTQKPLPLMQYLARLICPPGGTLIDPFAGSGTTAQAALDEGFSAILIEREAEYVRDICQRLKLAGVTEPPFPR